MKSPDWPPSTKGDVPKNEKRDAYKTSIENQIGSNLGLLNGNSFFSERLGGIERSINKSLVPALYDTPEHAASSVNYILDYFVENNVSTENQLQFLKALQFSFNDMQLLAEDKNANYEYVQFAYQWAGKARDDWKLSQETINSIISRTSEGLEKERGREEIPYLVSLYLDPENMLSRKTKIERFMQNFTPNLIDEVNHIYHFNPNGEDPVFLKLDTEEKRQEVKNFLSKVKKGWDKMFTETPTVKMYTHYPLPNEFKKFVLSQKEVKEYFPHTAFDPKGEILRGDMKNMLNPAMRESLENDTGIDLTKLQQEQAYFIEYISCKKRGEILPLKKFVNDFGKDGLKTFLSCAQEIKMGDRIIFLGEKIPKEAAVLVFKKYGEIVDNVNKIVEFAQHNFTKEIKTSPELIKKIEETLYIKGKQLLSQIYDDVSNEKEVNSIEIEKQLDRINADTITTFAIFKQAIKNGEKLPIESIEGSVFSKKEATDISPNQQNEMLELYELNWKNHPDRDFVESLKSYFKTAFAPEGNKQKNYFYTFEKDSNIRAFVRFEKQNDESFYASALNVDEASKNFGLGEAMMDEALTREAKQHILHASCRKDNPSNMRYFEKGFISRGFKKTNETEEFDLIWDENKNKDIKAKQKSQDELISMYGNTNTEEIEIRKSKELESLHGDISEGKSLVRCFVNNGEWYAVYETIKEDYGVNFGETE
ncbi:MAG: GNAT family N-acetyltransferase [bacterium]